MNDKKLVPAIRFRGFTDAWGQCRVGSLYRTEAVNLCKSPSQIGIFEVIQQGEEALAGYSNEKPYYDYLDVVLFGDHTLSLYKPTSPFLVATDGVKALISIGLDPWYFYYLLARYIPKNEGYKRYSVILKERRASFSPQKEEQGKIAGLFGKIDSVIALRQRKDVPEGGRGPAADPVQGIR